MLRARHASSSAATSSCPHSQAASRVEDAQRRVTQQAKAAPAVGLHKREPREPRIARLASPASHRPFRSAHTVLKSSALNVRALAMRIAAAPHLPTTTRGIGVCRENLCAKPRVACAGCLCFNTSKFNGNMVIQLGESTWRAIFKLNCNSCAQRIRSPTTYEQDGCSPACPCRCLHSLAAGKRPADSPLRRPSH